VRIVLLRLRLIGDVVFTTPLIRALRRARPDAHLAYVVEPGAAPIVTNNPWLDEVIVAPRTRGLRRLAADVRLARELRSRRFDVAVDLHGGPRSAWLTWASGARERIGYDIDGRRWMYTRVVRRTRSLTPPRHSVLNQWDLLEAIPDWHDDPATPGRDPVEMAVDPAADRRLLERLRRANVTARHALIVMHVSAGNPFRRWPEPFFVQTVQALLEHEPERRVVLSSGPSDRDGAARIAAAARQRLGAAAARIVELGDLDLQELRALIGRSILFIGGDTGPLHIAATTGTAIVGIYGPTLPARSAPWRAPDAHTVSIELPELACRPCDQRACAPGDFRCLTTLTPDRVIAAAESALAPTLTH
jgi:lipopolysaccharide heptosyltransferase II